MPADTPATADPRQTTLAGAAPKAAVVLAVLGLAALGGGLVFARARGDALGYFLHSYLLNYCYFLSISLGALFFVALQHATRAGWSVTVRRLAEVLAANMPVLVLLFLPILVPMVLQIPALRQWLFTRLVEPAGTDHWLYVWREALGNVRLYPWTDSQLVAGDDLLEHKAVYLNAGFFVARCVLYFAVWWLLARFFHGRSVEQDSCGDAELTRRMERLSPVALLLFAATITFASFDWLMSLDPHWFSTIYGVYYFSGAAVGFLAAVILAAMLLQATGRLNSFVTVEHYHDLGKLLFGFVVFWGYIAFSQYLLVWYANIPEETTWYQDRLGPQSGSWKWVSVLLLFGHLLIPFFGLLSREVKRRKLLLGFWAVWLLVAHWIDLYWLVMPGLGHEGLPPGLIDAACLVGIGSVYLAGVLRTAGKASLVPLGDPRLKESLAFRNV